MQIINYKFFTTNKEFIDWQKEKKRSIINVSPYPINMSGDLNTKDFDEETMDTKANLNMSFGVFVTYIEE